jgi:CRISPR-associated protein Csm4
MDALAYHLEARAPFHFGLRGVGIEATAAHAPSDTLFAAFCSALRQHQGQAALEEFLAGYSSPEPPLVLSSAFPYVLIRREEQVMDWVPPSPFDPRQAVRFYPRPLEPPPGVPDRAEERKRLKRIEWVSEGIFRAWVNDDRAGLAREWIRETTIGGQQVRYPNLAQGDHLWLTAEERERVAGWRDEETDEIRLWAVGDAPRVTVDRQANTSAVYQAGRLWFQPGGGLWLLMRWRADWQKRGEEALQVLGDAGMGGERSAGHGQFCPRGPHNLGKLLEPVPGGRFLTLSLYYPLPDELRGVIAGDGVNYRLRMRRGWMSSPDEGRDGQGNVVRGRALRRKAVRMFAEGSILGWPVGVPVRGALADVTPEAFGVHRVWRYGLACAVGYRPQGGAS